MTSFSLAKNTKERQLSFEANTLAPYAMHSSCTKGRAHPIEPCLLRTDYQRDRDRIVHCKSFRRLKHKTQVFLMPDNDHFRTRLTHTLEVAQTARTIARALMLNEDLTEAIAMGHDLGHTPFGHAGEEVLDALLPGGFEHNKESLRIVELLENDGRGLNLTFEVRDGILHHKRNGTPSTLEGRIVSYADRIAYLNHDIDDAERAGVMKNDDIPLEIRMILGETHGERINTMILDIVEASFGEPVVWMSNTVEKAMADLRSFMFENVYTNPAAKREEEKAKHVVEALYRFFVQNPKKMPSEFVARIQSDGLEIATADFIAMMTDRYAVQCYEAHFVPKVWHRDE